MHFGTILTKFSSIDQIAKSRLLYGSAKISKINIDWIEFNLPLTSNEIKLEIEKRKFTLSCKATSSYRKPFAAECFKTAVKRHQVEKNIPVSVDYIEVLCMLSIRKVVNDLKKWDFPFSLTLKFDYCSSVEPWYLARSWYVLSQVAANFIINFHLSMCAVGNPYRILGDAVIILWANGTLGAMPKEFAKQKGLWGVPWPERNKSAV